MKCPFKIKVCSKCKRILVAYEGNFAKKKGARYGLRSECKKCGKQHYKDNREKIRERQKQYRENNEEKIKEFKKQYYEKNKEKIKEKSKKWYEENKEYAKEHREKRKENRKEYMEQWREKNKKHRKEYSKEYYEENKEHIKEYKKQYKINNPDKVFNYHHKRRELKECQGRGIAKEQWIEMMEFFEWKCAYSGMQFSSNNKERDRTIDHIIPLSKGGEHEIWNLVPMCANYNYSKQDKDMLEWYKKQDFYSEERLLKIYEWIEYAKNKWENSNK